MLIRVAVKLGTTAVPTGAGNGSNECTILGHMDKANGAPRDEFVCVGCGD